MPPATPDPSSDPNLLATLQALGQPPRAQELQLDGWPVRRLAAQFGTPLYVFLASQVQQAVAAVTTACAGPAPIGILYSIKANPSLALTSLLRQLGTAAEVASAGEFALAIAAGHDPATLHFAGPGKGDAEIEQTVAAGLGCLHLEAPSEVAAVAAAARAHHRRVDVVLRVNLPEAGAGARLRMAGTHSRFGIDREQLPQVLAKIQQEPALRLRGLHAYGGTQQFSAEQFVQQARSLLATAIELETSHRVRLDELDFGGGFGVSTFVGDPEFDLAAAGAGLQQLLRDDPRRDRRYLIELGRFLVAKAGVYLTKVVRSKTSGGQRQLALDGGLAHHATACGQGSVLKRPPLLLAATRLLSTEREASTLGGPLCTPADQFASALPLAPLAEGDLIAILHAGAYGLSYSPHSFLSHPTPAEVLLQDGQARVIRARGHMHDVLRGQHS